MAAGGKPHCTGASDGVSVPHERTSVRMARQVFADRLAAAGVPPEERDDAMLVLSELVSNAVRHAAPLPSGEITARWEVGDDLLHIEITDGGGGTRPHPSVPLLSALGGRGLDIVRTVSSQWGVTEDHDTVTVWAEVPRTPRGLNRAAATDLTAQASH